jgi:Dolichyl-phosphate-mannose-protein mannosyltransferase
MLTGLAADATVAHVPAQAPPRGQQLAPAPRSGHGTGRSVPRAAAAAPGPRSRRHVLARLPWLLLAVLAGQAALSLRLVWSNTAFQDEALYLWAGRLEWSHWLHGTPIPALPTYFSGAPVIYPPIGALADSIGGLAGARILSLGFMLCATALLWSTASRLFGRRAGFFAAAVWAVLGPTQFLGAFATYDAMALCLVALAAWCAVRAGVSADGGAWLIVGICALALADMAKYASAIFDPVVIALVVLTAWPRLGAKRSLQRGGVFLAYLAAILGLFLLMGGHEYVQGVVTTTLARRDGSNSAGTVLLLSWNWTKTVLVVAVIGTVLCWTTERRYPLRLLMTLLTAAALLVPLEQARLHTTVSLHKHVDFGAWFAAMAVGYAVAKLVGWISARPVQVAALGACAAALIFPARLGMTQSRQLFASWPNSSQFMAAFRPLADHSTGRLLMENPSLGAYYSAAGQQWVRWSSTGSIRLSAHRVIAPGVGNVVSATVFQHLITRHFFEIVAVNTFTPGPLIPDITADLVQDSAYRELKSGPYGRGQYSIWELRSDPPARYDLKPLVKPPSHDMILILSTEGWLEVAFASAVFVTGMVIRVLWRRGKALEEP